MLKKEGDFYVLASYIIKTMIKKIWNVLLGVDLFIKSVQYKSIILNI